MKNTKYIIYARRSSDEKSGNQAKSIPDQIDACLDLAYRLGIKINKDKDIYSESKSAKTYDNRPIFNKIIHMIEKGVVEGIISWHPDRLSRNMFEAGKIIDLLDVGKIKDLKFCTHHFENTASGKMMLGIMFAISKEYSDKLSENISRGYRTNFEQGISGGKPKWGYKIDESGYYVPDEPNYSIIKKAWEMRLEGVTVNKIFEWLKTMDCHRYFKNNRDNKKYITKTALGYIFKDALYYGILRRKDKFVELKKIYDFQPMINQAEFNMVQKINPRAPKVYTKLELPFRDNIVKCECGKYCFPTIETGRKDRYLSLYCRDRMKCKSGKYRTRAKKIVDAISDDLENKFGPKKKNFEIVKERLLKAIEAKQNDDTKKIAYLNRKISVKKKEYDSLVLNCLKKEKDLSKEERKVYEREKMKLTNEIAGYEEERDTIKKNDVLKDFDYEFFSNFLKNISQYWKKANYKQKHIIAKIMFSNIVVSGGKVFYLQYNPFIADLFALGSGDGRSRTGVQNCLTSISTCLVKFKIF